MNPLKVVETNQKVGNGEPELITRFRWRARKRCKKLNKQREVNWYRFEVFSHKGKWEVMAMQNIALHQEDG